jgi:O-antigen/teichoic acid export membrane protein
MSIANKAFSILIRDAFLFVTQLVTSVTIARKLGPEMMGIWVILGMIPSYAESFGRMKFDIAAIYFLGKNKYRMGEVVFTLNALAIITSALIVILILWQFNWLYGLLFSKSTLNVRNMLHAILLQIPLNYLYMNYSYLLIYKEDINTYNWMIIIKSLVSSVGAIFLIFVLDLGIWAVVGASVLSIFLSLLYGAYKLGPTERPAHIINTLLIRDLFQYGSKLYMGGLIGHFQAYITNLIVALYLVPSQVAFFSMARGFGQLIDKVPTALNTILLPRLMKTALPEEAAQLSARASRLILVLLVIVGGIAFSLITPAVYILYGAEFLPLVAPFLILIPGIVIAGATTPFMQYFMGINRADLCITLPLLPLLLQVMLSFVLIPEFGPEGAAVAFTSGLVLFSLISTWMFVGLSGCALKRDLVIRWNDIHYLHIFFADEARRMKNFFSQHG